jgi:hypothetical protein
VVAFKNSPHLDARSSDSSDNRLELHVDDGGQGSRRFHLQPSGGGLYKAEMQHMCTPAIIQGLLLPPLHHQYPLHAEMALVKRAWLLGIGHCKASHQTGHVKYLQVIRLSSEVDGSHLSAAIPSPDSTRDLALHPEAFDMHVQQQYGIDTRTTLGLKLSTMWSLSCQVSMLTTGLQPSGLDSAWISAFPHVDPSTGV